MKDIVRTTVLISSIAMVVAMMFLAPKGFQMGEPSPIMAVADTLESAALD